MASGSRNSQIFLWDAQSGRKIRVLEGYLGSVWSLAFSPDNKRLVSASNGKEGGTIRLWNVGTGTLLLQLHQGKEKLDQVAFSPNGKTIASIGVSKRVYLWDAQTGKLTRSWTGKDPECKVSALAFTPDSNTLVIAGSTGKICFWNLQTGKEHQPDLVPEGRIHIMAFSPDGALLATGDDKGIRLYQASNWAENRRLTGYQGEVDWLAFAPDGKTLLSASSLSPICLLDVGTGKHLRELVSESHSRRHKALSPDGRTLATGDVLSPGVIEFWDARTGGALPRPSGYLGYVKQVAFLENGETVATTTNDSQAVVWRQGSDKEPRHLKLPQGSKTCVVSLNGSTLAIAGEESLLLRDIPSGKELLRCPIPKTSEVLALSADNKRAVLGIGDFDIQVWDLTTRKLILWPEGETWGLQLSPNGRMLALKNGETVDVWDLDTKKKLCQCEFSEMAIRAFALSPDGRMLCINHFDGTIRFWEIATTKERLRIQGHSGQVSSASFSPDGRMLASGSYDRTVRLWDLRDGKQLHVFTGHLSAVGCVAFSPDGGRLISGSYDTTALIWKIPPVCRNHKLQTADLGLPEQDRLWNQMADIDAAAAYAAQQRLARAPSQAVCLCQARFFNTRQTSSEQIQRWITQLDDEEYEVREKASRNLENVEIEAAHALQTALKGNCSPEARRRMEALLEILKGKDFRIRPLRAVELLEQVGTAKAVDVLRELEKKTGDAALRDEVRQSLRRLARNGGTP